MNTRGQPAQQHGGGFAAAHPRVRRAGYGPAPPASRLLRTATRRPCGPVLTPETSADPGGQEARAGQDLPRTSARRTRDITKTEVSTVRGD
jgi:hypothetical protein